MIFERRMRAMRRSARRVHIGRVEHDAIDLPVPIGQGAAIVAVLNVGGPEFVPAVRDVAPEHALSVSDVGDDAAGLHVKIEDARENAIVPLGGRTPDEVVRRIAVAHDAFWG